MKAAFVGGGAHRLVGVLRGAMAHPGLLDGGHVHLHDLDGARAEAVGRMVMKTPEYARVGCKITWGTSLEDALEGADAVGVILMAGSRRTFALGDLVSRRHGFLSSDNVSPNGAFLAVKGGRTLLGIARGMERLCPDAWLMDFANPVAVFSAMLNNHTRIKTLGVCAGYLNHQYDLPRLMGRDEQDGGFEVEVAGTNHLSFILKGAYRGEDLFAALERHLTPEWKPPHLHACWSEVTRRNIRKGLRRMIEAYRELGVLIFSTEGDGMWHLFYEEALADWLKQPAPTRAQIEAGHRAWAQQRAEADRQFGALLDRELDEAFWRKTGDAHFALVRQEDDIFVRCLRGIGGEAPVRLVASRPSRGAVAGIKDRTVVEYSQVMRRGVLEPAGTYTLPDSVHGLISSLATHQTLLGDAVATEDPAMLAQALLAYPVRPYSKAARALYRDLLEVNAEEIPPALRETRQYL